MTEKNDEIETSDTEMSSEEEVHTEIEAAAPVAEEAAPAAEEAAPASSAGIIPELAGLRFLLVEESKVDASQRVEALRGSGATIIDVAENDDAALAFLEDHEYACLVVNWETGSGGNGLFLQKLRRMPAFRTIPCLVYANELRDEDIFLAVEFGAKKQMVEPFTAERFSDRLRDILYVGHPDAETYRTIGRLSKAIANEEFSKEVYEDLENLYVNNTENAEIIVLMGDYYFGVTDYQQALTLYRRAIELNPKSLRFMNKLTKVLMLLKQVDEAVGVMESLRAISPQNIDRLVDLGEMYLQQGDAKEAEKAFDGALEGEPENMGAQDGKGKSLFAQGEFKKAFKFIKNTENADEMATYFNNLAIALRQQNRFEEAVRLYMNALHMLPDFKKEFQLLFNIGLAYKKDNAMPIAAAFFKTSAEREPDFAKATVNLKEVHRTLHPNNEVAFDTWLTGVDTDLVTNVIKEKVGAEVVAGEEVEDFEEEIDTDLE